MALWTSRYQRSSLSWHGVTNAAIYAVQISNSLSFSTTVYGVGKLTDTSTMINGLTLANKTAYYWRGGAKDTGGVSGWSSAWTFTTIIAAPAPPVLATPTNGAGNQPLALSLNWSTSALSTSYEVQVSLLSTFGTTLFDQSGASLTSAMVGGFANGTTYYWRANASNIGGTSWSPAWTFTTIIAAPAPPVLASPTNGAGNQLIALNLGWSTSAGATLYEAEVSASSGFETTLFDQSGATLTGAAVSGLANSTTYYWRVNASNIGGTSWSPSWTFTTIVAVPAPPALASPTNGAGNQPIALSLSWSTSAGATLYEAEVSMSSGFGTTLFDQSGDTLTGAAVSGLANSTTYYWRANASNIGGTSWSPAWTFTTIVAAPAAPMLSLPADNARGQMTRLDLSWNSAEFATSYGVEVSAEVSFGSTIFAQSGLTATSTTFGGLANGSTYYWRANAANSSGTSAWSKTWDFTTSEKNKCGCGSGTGLALIPAIWFKARSWRRRKVKAPA